MGCPFKLIWAKCNTTLLCQDIQKLVIFAHENAILQCCVRYLETDNLCSSKCNTTVLCQDIQKLVIFTNKNAILQCCVRISKIWLSLFLFCNRSSVAQGSERPVLVYHTVLVLWAVPCNSKIFFSKTHKNHHFRRTFGPQLMIKLKSSTFKDKICF